MQVIGLPAVLGHLIVFLNLALLGVGIGIGLALLRLYLAWRRPATFWQFSLFLSFTLTMAAAALSAYSIVNIGFDPLESKVLASAVLAGSAGMLLSLPHLAITRTGRRPSLRFSVLWACLAAAGLCCAGALPFLADMAAAFGAIGLALGLLFASILYSLALGTRHDAARAAASWIALFLLSMIAAAEIGWILSHPPEKGYFLLTLPLAYLYFCWSAWRERVALPAEYGLPTVPGPAPPGASGVGTPALPPSLAEELRLTEREREIAVLILEGRANKELAGDLGISANTVRNHIYNLYRKLGIQKRLDLVLLVRKYQGKSGLSGS